MEIVEKNTEITEIEKAQLILEKEKEDRTKKCFEDIKSLLEKHNCDLTIIHSVNEQNQIVSQINVFAK